MMRVKKKRWERRDTGVLYICDDCGAEFEDPAMCTYKHYPDGEFSEEMTEYQCPYCGSEYVGKAEE